MLILAAWVENRKQPKNFVCLHRARGGCRGPRQGSQGGAKGQELRPHHHPKGPTPPTDPGHSPPACQPGTLGPEAQGRRAGWSQTPLLQGTWQETAAGQPGEDACWGPGRWKAVPKQWSLHRVDLLSTCPHLAPGCAERMSPPDSASGQTPEPSQLLRQGAGPTLGVKPPRVCCSVFGGPVLPTFSLGTRTNGHGHRGHVE